MKLQKSEMKLRMSPNYWTYYFYKEDTAYVGFKRTEGKNGKVKHEDTIAFETVADAKEYFDNL